MDTQSEIRVLTPDERAELKRLAEAAFTGPWAYRSQEFDDWGVVRGPLREDGHRVHLAKVTAPYAGQEQMQAHREAGTDPYEANGRYIAAVSPDLTLGTLAYVEQLERELATAQVELSEAKLSERYAGSEAERLAASLSELRGQVTSLLEDLANGCVPVQMGPGVATTPYWRGVNTERANGLKWAELKCKELGIEWPIKAISYTSNLPAPVSPSSQDPAGAEPWRAVFDSQAEYDASVESAVARIERGEVKPIEQAGKFTGCWYNAACPCNPTNPNECPCYQAPDSEINSAAAAPQGEETRREEAANG